MLKIVVLLKQTFDTEEKIVIKAGTVDENDAKFVINPYDEYALEEALRQKERLSGEVIAITCGPERAQDALRTALAIGADEAIRLDSASLPDDSYAIAAVLAAVIASLSPDLLLAGLFAVDSGAGSVALQIAERLGLPHASSAVKLTLLSKDEWAALPAESALQAAAPSHAARFALVEGDIEGDTKTVAIPLPAESVLQAAAPLHAERFALVERDIEGDTETVVIPLPALITAQQGLNEPRYPSLPGIMKAKRKPLRVITPAELISSGALDAASITPRTVRAELLPPPPRAAGKRLSGAPQEQAAALVSLLREEAKLPL
ncbi:electron transfer flavoprotein subunit beta/FixA family protein [Paenibacillus sinopodophylli]|uniref:electron transfer flavoprotein subunit beta/FixA family protein n=1 Tax=Paenibacillus sinopodophylli TaxID=1837342 RepID=UPI00110D1A54|nr:electron transfer flavoprotein subunit beta [Paenibacillus sinopodophylli]